MSPQRGIFTDIPTNRTRVRSFSSLAVELFYITPEKLRPLDANKKTKLPYLCSLRELSLRYIFLYVRELKIRKFKFFFTAKEDFCFD